MTYARTPDSMTCINIKLAAGGWVSVCRVNAERLVKLAHVQVQVKYFSTRRWEPMNESYIYRVRTVFRARNNPRLHSLTI